MRITNFKALTLAVGVLALSLSACGGSSSPQTRLASQVGISASFLGFGDSLTFTVTAENTVGSDTYSSGSVPVTSSSAEIPATGEATLTDVPFGTYNFTVVVSKDGVVEFTNTYTNGGIGYAVEAEIASFTLDVALGDGQNTTGIVSNFYSDVSVTLNFDFPPEVALLTDDIEPLLDWDGLDDNDYVGVQLANDSIIFTDYEEAAAGDTDGIDLCSSGDASYIDLAFSVKKSDGTTCALSDDDVTVRYESAGFYTAASCGGIVDCCRFEAKLAEADLGDCASAGETLHDYQSFIISVTGTDSSDNSSSATVTVQMQ